MLAEKNLKIRAAASGKITQPNSRSKLTNFRSYVPNDGVGLKLKKITKTNNCRPSDVEHAASYTDEVRTNACHEKQKTFPLSFKQSNVVPPRESRNTGSKQSFALSKQNNAKFNHIPAKSNVSHNKQIVSRCTGLAETTKDSTHPTLLKPAILGSFIDRSEMGDNPSCAHAVTEVQQVWDKFVAISTVISRLECLMVLTKIEHVLNEEYQVYYQRYPYVSDPSTTKQNEDFEKSRKLMEDLRVKIVLTRELEDRIAALSRVHEVLQSEMNVLLYNSKTTANSLRGRSSLERAASLAIRENLAKVTNEVTLKKEKLAACTAELDGLEKELAVLLQDSHPVYASLFLHPDENRNPAAAEEERKYIATILALQQRACGFMSPSRQQSEESQDSDCDPDWQWLEQFTADKGVTSKDHHSLRFSDDLCVALQMGRTNFEQIYLVGVDFPCGDSLTAETDSIDVEDILSGKAEDIERMHGEPSLIFLRRLRCRCFQIKRTLHTIRQLLTTKLTALQDCKPRDRPSSSPGVALNSFRSPGDSSVLSFATIYQNDEQGPPSFNRASLKVAANQRTCRPRQPPSSPTRRQDSGKVDSNNSKALTSTPPSKEKRVSAEETKTVARRTKPAGFLDPASYLSTRKNCSLSSRSFGYRSRSIDAVESDRMALALAVSPVLSPPVGSSARPVSPIALLKEMIHNSTSKKKSLEAASLSSGESKTKDNLTTSSKAVLGLFFDYEDLDELNQLILKYLADKRSMSVSVDPQESAADFNEVLKSVKVKVLSDLLKRDLAIADELQASQVQLLTIPETVDCPVTHSDSIRLTTSAESTPKLKNSSIDVNVIDSNVTTAKKQPPKVSTTMPKQSNPSPSSATRSKPKVTLLEQFKMTGEMICVESEDVPPQDSKSNQDSIQSQESKPSSSKDSKSSGVSLNLDTIYKCDSYNEFIDAITQHELDSDPYSSVPQSRPVKKLFDNNDCPDESDNIEVIKSKLNKIHQSSHKKKANPAILCHTTRSSCLICTHLPQIFGNFSEACTPVGVSNNVQSPPRTIKEKDNSLFIGEEYNVLAQGSLTKPGMNAAGERDEAVASTTKNKIIVSFNAPNGTKLFSTPTKSAALGATNKADSVSKRIGVSSPSPWNEKTKKSGVVATTVRSPPPTIKSRVAASNTPLHDNPTVKDTVVTNKSNTAPNDDPKISSDYKATTIQTYYSPSLNPLSRLHCGVNNSPNRRASVMIDLEVANKAVESHTLEESSPGNPKSYLSVMAGNPHSSFTSTNTSEILDINSEPNSEVKEQTCTGSSEFSGFGEDDNYLSNENYVSPPSEIVNLSVSMSMDTSLRQPLFPQHTPAMPKSILRNVSKLGIESSQSENPMQINENELSSIKLYDTLQKMHVKYFVRRKRHDSSSKSALDDMEIEYSSPILLKNEFIDRILFGNGDKSNDKFKMLHCSSDDMSTSLEADDLAELSNLLSNYAVSGASNAAAEKAPFPSALAALKLFATRKKEMALSLRHWKNGKYKSCVDNRAVEQKTDLLLPCRSTTKSGSGSSGSVVDGTIYSPQSTSLSSMSSDSISLTNLTITKEIKRSSSNRDLRHKNEMELQSVMEKLAKLKIQLGRSSSSGSSGTPLKDSACIPSQPASPLLQSPQLSTIFDEEKEESSTVSSFVKPEEDQEREIIDLEEQEQPSPNTTESHTTPIEETCLIPSIVDTKAAVADEINLFLLDYLSRQQKEIDELKRTQDTINDLLFQRRDISSLPSKDSPLKPFHTNSESQNFPVDSNIYTVKEFNDSTDAYCQDFISASSFPCTVIPEDTDDETLTPELPTDDNIISEETEEAAVLLSTNSLDAHTVEPLNSGGDLEANIAQIEAWPTQHCRRPSATDSVMSALTNSTGLSSAPPVPAASHSQQSLSLMSEMKVTTTPPPQLQRLRFQSFLEAAQGYSPNYKFNNRFNYSPNFNTSNFAANRELEEMVTFLGSKIDKCESKCLQLLEQEHLDNRTHTIAVDPLDGRSKAYVEVTIKSAKNVPEMKKLTRSADCYVEMKLVKASSHLSSNIFAPYTNTSATVYRSAVKENTLYPEWMEDFKIADITDLLHDKLLITLRDSSKGSSACVGPERDEIIGQGLLHFMGGELDEYTNILLDQHLHCVSIALTPPLQPSTANLSMLQHSYASTNSRLSLGAASLSSAAHPPVSHVSHSNSSSRRSSFPKHSGLSSYGSNSCSAIAPTASSDGSHLHSCSIRLDVKLFFSKRRYWEHQKLDYTRLLYKLLGQSAPDLCQSLYPQLAQLAKPPAAAANSSMISKADVDRIRQMMLRETATTTTTTTTSSTTSQHLDGINGRSSGSASKADEVATTHKYSDILGGGSVAGMSKNMSHIRGLREKPPAGTYMGKHGVHAHRTTTTTNTTNNTTNTSNTTSSNDNRKSSTTSNSSVGSGATSTASTLSQRSRNRPRTSTGSVGFRSR